MIPVVVLLARDGVVVSDIESRLALYFLVKSDRSVLANLRAPLIADVKAGRFKSNLPSILLPIYRPLNPRFGFKQVSWIFEATLAITSLFSTLQESGDSGIESNLQVR